MLSVLECNYLVKGHEVFMLLGTSLNYHSPDANRAGYLLAVVNFNPDEGRRLGYCVVEAVETKFIVPIRGR